MQDRRRQARYDSVKLLKVFSRESDRQIGELANLSSEGAMLITDEPVKSLSVLQCRVELERKIMNQREIIFDAECRWCRKNIKKGWWESGYKLRMSGIDQEIVSYLSLSFSLGRWGISNLADAKTTVKENQRIATRYDVKDPFPVFEKYGYREIGNLADLSVNGAGLRTAEPVEKGRLLHCKVRLPKKIFRQEYLVFDAECRWCRKRADGEGHNSGYALKNVSEQDAVIILYIIIHLLEEQPSRQKIRVIH